MDQTYESPENHRAVQGDFFKRLGHWEERKKVSHVGEEFKAGCLMR
jgi:hypothetical protein